MNKLAILGASGHGKVVAELAELLGYQVTFFDDAFPDLQVLEHWTVEGNSQQLLARLSQYHAVHVAIGNNSTREKKQQLLAEQGGNFPSLVHPRAIVSHYACLGPGSVVMAGATVNPFAQIEAGSIINSNAVVEHDCVLGAFCHISPNATLCGGAKVGTRSWIGAGSTVKQLITIEHDCTIGAGSSVILDVSAYQTVVGTPAKPLP